MNLKELLAKKSQEKNPTIENEVSFSTFFSDSIETPNKEEFFLYWSYCVTHPYLDPQIRRELKSFFLGETAYVLNTFTGGSEQVLFTSFMTYNPPNCPYHLHLLWLLIKDIELFVPIEYYEALLLKISGIDKNSRIG